MGIDQSLEQFSTLYMRVTIASYLLRRFRYTEMPPEYKRMNVLVLRMPQVPVLSRYVDKPFIPYMGWGILRSCSICRSFDRKGACDPRWKSLAVSRIGL